LKAGILDSHALVVVSPENQRNLEDDALYDSPTIFAMQNIFRLFPKTNVVAEIRKASNIRFMKFRDKNVTPPCSSFVLGCLIVRAVFLI
jgi:hypothetical protein